MTTIKEIAQRTHVSAATVSNVLNGKGGASAAKEREIRDVAAALRYTPNLIAKRLKKQRSNTIGIITEDLTVFNTPSIVDGADACCEENGYEIILGNMRLFKKYNNDFTDTVQHQHLLDNMIQSMLSKQVEGLVYIGYHSRELRYLPDKLSIPLVYAYCYPQGGRYPSVVFNDEQAAYENTTLLIRNGHRKIGAICGPLSGAHTLERLKGFQRALFDNHILFDPSFVAYGDWGLPSGCEAAGPLLEAGVTGIFAFNDWMAGGVYAYCAQHGLRVGRDVSVTGFDNRDISVSYDPMLTTVELPLEEMGRLSTQMVMDALRGEPLENRQRKLPCRIIERASVGPPPQ